MTETLSRVVTEVDRPPAPAMQAVPSDGLPMSFAIVVGIQLLFGIQLLGMASEAIDWVGQNRAADVALDHVDLLRSYTLTTLSLNAGGGGALAELLCLIAVLACVGAAACSMRWINGGDLPGLLAGIAALTLLASGLLRFGSPLEHAPTWIGRLLLVVITALLGLGAFRSLSYRPATSGAKFDLFVVLATGVTAVIVPLMLAFGFWQQESRYADMGLDAQSEALEPVRVWLILGGAAPVAIVGGYLLARPPMRRGTAVLGLLLVAAGWVYLGHIEEPRLVEEQPQVEQRADEQTSGADSAGQVSADDPAGLVSADDGSDCGAATDSAGTTIRFGGNECRQYELTTGGDVVNAGALRAGATPQLDVVDPLNDQRATQVAFQRYGDLLVVAEIEVATGTSAVTAYRISSSDVAWQYDCEEGDASNAMKVRFSGGAYPDEAASARFTEDLYGTTTYVGVNCAGQGRLLNPQTGETY